MIVLGIDTSTRTGVSVLGSGKKLLHTEEVYFKKLSGLDRVSSIASRVAEVVEEFRPNFAVIENYGFANSHTLVPLVEIGTVVRYFLWQDSLPFLLVPPTSLKKFLGKGNFQKEEVRLKCYQQYGFEHPSNNVVDAYVLSMIGLALTGDYPLCTYQFDALKSVQDLRESPFWNPSLKTSP